MTPRPAPDQQPRQALYSGDSRYRGWGVSELGGQQRECRQSDAITEVGQEPRQPIPGERPPESVGERDHPSIMPDYCHRLGIQLGRLRLGLDRAGSEAG
jgi:hypothetical protein